MKQINFYLLLLCLAAFSQTAFAQATLSVQGVLKNSDGSAVDNGKYSLGFKLYNSATGGTAIWTETQSDVLVTGGIYSVLLGSTTPLTAAFDETYYIGVTVDGGAELVPRARLTSSPYALSLLGTDNLFPSSGAIGAGTITPVAGYQLHVKNGSGAGKALVEGSTAGQIDFKKGSTVASVGFGTANNDFIVNPGANNTTLQHNGTTKLTVTTNGAEVPGTLTAGTVNAGTLTATNFSPANMTITSKLAIGQSSVDANNTLKVEGGSFFHGGIEIDGYKNLSSPGGLYFQGACNNDRLCYYGAGSQSVSIKATNYLLAFGFLSISDRRVKKDFHRSENLADLATLRKLPVTDYRHIDEIEKGSDLRKGFLAQEVKEVFPEAVTLSSDFIPNVYALSSKTKLAAGKLTIVLDKNHEFAVGDEVKLMMPDDSQKRTTVAAVSSENTFSIDWDGTAAPEQVFVFGKKVADFHTVDYERIFTLNVSATQELAREMEELKKENAALKSALEKKDGEMKASAEKFDARLRALENKLSN